MKTPCLSSSAIVSTNLQALFRLLLCRSVNLFGLLFLFAAGCPLQSNASSKLDQQSFNWIGDIGNWDEISNWEPAGIPGPGDLVSITNGEVNIGGDRSVQQLSIGSLGSLTGSGNLAISDALNLTFTNARLEITGDISVGGVFTWSAGLLGGEGKLTSNQNITITGGVGSGKTLDNRELIVIEGTTLTMSGVQFGGRNGARILIEEDALLDLTMTNNFSVFTVSEGGAEIINNGTIRKITGLAGVIPIDWTLVNNGLILVDQPDAHLRMTGALQDNGGIYRLDNGTLTFDSRGRTDAYELTSASSIITQPGTLLRFSSFPNSMENTIYELAGLIDIQGDLVVNKFGAFGANNAVMRILPDANLLDLAADRLIIGTGGELVSELQGEVFLNHVTLNVNSYLEFSGNVIIDSTFNLLNNGAVFHSDHTTTVNGEMEWRGGRISGSGTTITSGGLQITGTSFSAVWTKRLAGHRLLIPDGQTALYTGYLLTGSDGGSLEIAEGAVLDLVNTQTSNFFNISAGGARLINRGTITMTDGPTSRYDIHWDFENHGLLFLDQEGAHIQFMGRQFDDGGEYRVIQGRLTFNAITNPDLNIFAAGSLIYGGPESTIVFAARANYADLQQLNTYYEIHGDIQIMGNLIIRRTEGDRFSNLTIMDQSGEIDLAAANVQVGDNYGRLFIERTDSLLTGSVHIGFAGTIITNGVLTIVNDFLMESGRTGTEVSVFESDHPVYVLGKTTWRGGTMRGESRTYATGGLEITGIANSVLQMKRLEQRGLILPEGVLHTHNGGQLTGADGGYIHIEPGAEFRITAGSDYFQFVHGPGGAGIVNHGLLSRSGGNTARMNVDWNVENHGRIEIDQENGHFRFSRSIDDQGGEYHAEKGRLNIALAASPDPYIFGSDSRFTASSDGWINFGGQNGNGLTAYYEHSGTFNIDGILSVRNLSGLNTNSVRPDVTLHSNAVIENLASTSLQTGNRFGQLTIDGEGAISVGKLEILQNGRISLKGPLTVLNDFLLDGNNSGVETSHAIDVNGLMTWSGGTFSGTGTTRFNGGFEAAGSATSFGLPKNLVEHHLHFTGGNSLIAGTQLTARDGARMTIGEEVTLNITSTQNNFNIPFGSTELPVFYNQGTIVSDQDNSFIINNWQIINEGILDFGKNSMTLQSNREITNRGIIRGTGTISANLLNESGLLAPGHGPHSTGVITVTGVYTQLEDATTQLKIGGPVPGTDHDQIKTGSANLNGTLLIELKGDFSPPLNQLYNVITWPSGNREGSFSNFDLPDLPELILTGQYADDGLQIFTTDGISTEPPPFLIGSVSSPPFQRTGRNVTVSTRIQGSDSGVILRIRGRYTNPPRSSSLTPECPTDDGYENLKCRLAPFGIVPPPPEEGETYPILPTNPFPQPLAPTGDPTDQEWERTTVIPPGESLDFQEKIECPAGSVEAELEIGSPASDVNLVACAYAIARVLFDFTIVPGKACFQLALGIGEYVIKGTYEEEFDLAAYMAANILGAFSCAGELIPPSKVTLVIFGITDIIGTYGLIQNARNDCRSVDTSETVATASRTETSCVASFDPNDKIGPEGTLAERFIASGDSMAYTVFFENLESATAAAQVVIITDTLDLAVVDLNTFSYGMVAWTDTATVLTPDSLNAFRASTDVDLRPAMDLVVRVEADLNPDTGVITWVFDSLDPVTMEPTEDPLAGFLPPNNETFDGEGLVSYFVSLKENVPSATRFGSAARIIFDENEPIDTPVWSNILDTEAPVSTVDPLDSVQTSAGFNVSWSGSDDASGIQHYTIYVSENGAEPEIWLADTADQSQVFNGNDGSTYAFWSTATDWVGNRSEGGTEPEAVTTVQLPTSIEQPDLPAEFSLSQNYPNPFNPTTVIRFGLPEAADVRLEIYDIAGRRVAILADDTRAAGWYKVNFDGSALASGVYIYRLQAGDYVQSKKFVLVK